MSGGRASVWSAVALAPLSGHSEFRIGNGLFSCIHFGMDDWGNWHLNFRCKGKTMKTKICLLGIFVFLTLAIAAPRTWVLKTGEMVTGDYVSSGTTTLVVKTDGTNCFLNISDLSTNELPYLAQVQLAQRQARLNAEVKQMQQAGMIEFTKEILINCNTEFLARLMNENNQSQSMSKWGWMDADYVGPSSTKFWIDANSPPITASFCVVDKDQDKLDIYCLDASRASLSQTIAGLKHGDRIRLIGVALPAGGGMPAFEINKIEMIESAAEKKAVEQRDATAP